MSLLAVSVQFFATAEVLFRLGPAAFYPPPKVDSAVVRIQVADTPRVDVAVREEFFDVVRAGFRQPRKQLHNALSQGLWLPRVKPEPLRGRDRSIASSADAQSSTSGSLSTSRIPAASRLGRSTPRPTRGVFLVALSRLAPAKINLTLEVTSRRSDGYHEISSVMSTVSLTDTISVDSGRGFVMTADEDYDDRSLRLEQGNMNSVSRPWR